MEENRKNLAGAVLVGKTNDDFIQFCVKILDQYQIGQIVCPDIYTAVVQLAKKENVLVTGRFCEMSKENGKLFDIARRNGHNCCCLRDSSSGQDGNVDYSIKEPGEFEEVVRILFERYGTLRNKDTEIVLSAGNDLRIRDADPGQGYPGRRYGGNFDFNRVDFAPSKAEIDALLGGLDI